MNNAKIEISSRNNEEITYKQLPEPSTVLGILAAAIFLIIVKINTKK